MVNKHNNNEPILKLEQRYCETLQKKSSELKELYSKAIEHPLSLHGEEITKAIIFRMKTYYETHDETVRFLETVA